MRRYVVCLLLVWLLGVGIASAQRHKDSKDSKESEAVEAQTPPKNFVEQLREDYAQFYRSGGVFEKLYLMTDKPYYSAGETLYFSGFLVHATLLTRISDTEFIYAELISPEGRLVERVKICAEDKHFVGTFALSPRLTSGRYTLRAYSRWMTNFDMGYFFTKEVVIGNYIDDAIHTAVSYRTNPNGTVSAFVRFSDQYSLPLVSTQVRYRTVVDTRSKSGVDRTDNNGTIEIKFRPSDNPNDCIELNIRANSRELSRFVQMPSFSEDYDVQFCPEGGNLVGGMVQVVAFKAQAANGKAKEVSGKVYNAAGEVVAEMKSSHCGMGRFVLRPLAGQTYYAEVSVHEGPNKRFDLPEVAPSGVALRVMYQGEGVRFMAQATPDLDIADYAAVVHSRGAVMTVINDLSHPARLLNKDMFDGIAQVSVVNRASRMIVAERLFYVRDRRYATAEVKSERGRYEQRDKVVMTLEVKDSDGKPAKGNFALSVTDGNVVTIDDSAPNILSYMLLSSDLKGEVEDAGQYFVDDSPRTLDNLDLVMMTNGWRRYSLASVMAHEFPHINYPVEDSQRIMGSVFGLFGKAKKPSVVVMDPKTKFVQQFELNEYNNFIISGLDAFSTTSYIVQALNKKGRDNSVRIEIETENYPTVVSDHRREYYKEQENIIPENFLTRAKEKYFYEGGERIIDIDEVVVVGRKRSSGFFTTANSGSLLHGDLSRFATVYDALSTFKELNVLGNNITTVKRYVESELDVESAGVAETMSDDGSGEVVEESFSQVTSVFDDDLNVPELYVNGNISDINFIDSYETKYIERLSFVDGKSAYMLGLSAPAGAILMEVSQEGLYNTVSSDAMARVVVRACQKPAAFYKPKYPTFDDRLSSVRDMRSTIAWEPVIRTNEAGLATISFYTADRSGTYDVVVEGITDEGELCRSHTNIEVEYASLIK
ncbi:MAG: hypothetical protein IJ348_04545 [Alistipes sp.]|nr:hypothetical protein [Alistipes sp.]